jgi:hypothetical protein
LTELGFPENTNSVPSLDLKLSAYELAIKTVDEIVPAAKKNNIHFTYATDDKCYFTAWWDDFYAALLQEFDYNIIEILPVENVSNLNLRFIAKTFVKLVQ